MRSSTLLPRSTATVRLASTGVVLLAVCPDLRKPTDRMNINKPTKTMLAISCSNGEGFIKKTSLWLFSQVVPVRRARPFHSSAKRKRRGRPPSTREGEERLPRKHADSELLNEPASVCAVRAFHSTSRLPYASHELFFCLQTVCCAGGRVIRTASMSTINELTGDNCSQELTWNEILYDDGLAARVGRSSFRWLTFTVCTIGIIGKARRTIRNGCIDHQRSV